jgi:protein involved in polysaccharide export with SLBB domain
VSRPGRYLARNAERVSNVVEWAFADSVILPVANADYRPALRRVEVTHRDGSQSHIDVLRYYTTGDLGLNPPLRDGDQIRVPAYRPASESISIDGFVPFAGRYDHRPGDTVLDAVALASGESEPKNWKVRISRRSEAGGDTVLVLGSDRADTELRPLDHIFVEGDANPAGWVRLEGRVRYPGTYPISSGSTTLSELVDRAGGLLEDALSRRTYMYRIDRAPILATGVDNRFDGAPYWPVADTSGFWSEVRLAGFDFAGVAYAARELKASQRVALNLQQHLDSDADPLVLRDGDSFFVPTDYGTVFVFGQVVRPSHVPFAAGASVSHYIAEAGGLSESATDVYIIDAGTRQYVAAEAVAVRSGDMIFVGSNVPTTDNLAIQSLVVQQQTAKGDQRIRRQQLWLQGAALVASTITTLILILDKSN